MRTEPIPQEPVISADQSRRRGTPVVVLTSGKSVRLNSVLLYPGTLIAEIASLRAQAAVKLGGVSTGIGFIGSPGWAIGGSVALGLLESALSSVAQKEGLRLAQAADQRATEVEIAGRFFPMNSVVNSEWPTPAKWNVPIETVRMIDVSNMGWGALGAFLKEHNKSKADVVNGKVNVTDRISYIHNGDDFCVFETDIGPIHIRWSYVAGYMWA
jgi:hypothetical protein